MSNMSNRTSIRKIRLTYTLVALASLAAVFPAYASTGGLEVHVSDESGPLPGATVVVSNEQGLVKTEAQTSDRHGVAFFPVLHAGRGYTVSVSMSGLTRTELPGIQIAIGEIRPLRVKLSKEMIEIVEVTGEPRVVELTGPDHETNFDEEFVDGIPTMDRQYTEIIAKTAGVLDADGDGNANVNGARDRDSKAEVAGVSNKDPYTGRNLSRVNPDAIEAVSVQTAGAGARYGGAQGSFSQVLLKQGSNELEFAANLLLRSSRLDGSGPSENDATQQPDFRSMQPSLQLSGPIVRDHLWFRVSHERIDREDPVSTGKLLAVQKTIQDIHSSQLTWQASARNKLAFNFQSDPGEVHNAGVSAFTPPDSAMIQKRGGDTYSLTWTAPFSSKVLIQSRLAWQHSEAGISPQTVGLPNDCVDAVEDPRFEFLMDSRCFDADTGETSGSFNQTWDDERQRMTVRSDATLFTRMGGTSNTFRAGFIVENERFFRRLDESPSLTRFVLDPAQDAQDQGQEEPEPIEIFNAQVRVPQVTTSRATAVSWGIYAEDQIKPLSNLVLDIGLRIDREEINAEGFGPFDPQAELREYMRFVNEEGLDEATALRNAFTAYESIPEFLAELSRITGVGISDLTQGVGPIGIAQAFGDRKRRNEDIRVTNTNFAPRLSLSWDPWSTGKTKVAISAGRYYGRVPIEIPFGEAAAPTTSVSFRRQGNEPLRLADSISPALSIRVFDHNLRTPYVDELSFVLEREIAKETSLRFSYVNKNFRDQFQDIDINRQPGDFGSCRVPSALATATVSPSPGSGHQLVDVYTGEIYIDTDPGRGDGISDDCAGETFLVQGSGGPTSAELAQVQRPDGIADLYVQNPLWSDVLLVGNVNTMDYEGYSLILHRRQHQNWQMQASYTYSKAEGDGEDYDQFLGNDASNAGIERAYQSYDQRHALKVDAVTNTPWGFRLGGSVAWFSGLPYSVLTQRPSFNQVVPELNSFGSTTEQSRLLFENGQRNTERNPSYWEVDASLVREMSSREMSIQLRLDVFNLLDDDSYRIWERSSESGFVINGRSFGEYRFGRRYQLSARIAF